MKGHQIPKEIVLSLVPTLKNPKKVGKMSKKHTKLKMILGDIKWTLRFGKEGRKMPSQWIRDYSQIFLLDPLLFIFIARFYRCGNKNHKVLTTYTQISKPLDFYMEDFVISYLGPCIWKMNCPDFHHLSFWVYKSLTFSMI